MDWYENYLQNFAQDNEDFYREYAQEWINDSFEDTTLLRIIQEQEFPFSDIYLEQEVHVDSVSDVSVNVNKVIGDYVSFIFKDCNHMNYRGQKYIYDNETYLCYDKINKLSRVAKTKVIRCNNILHWIDKNTGKIYEEPIFLGHEISSTNDLVNKDANVPNARMIILVQANENTMKIKSNQRFMFQHETAFRVEEVNNFMQEEGTNGEVTLIKLYLKYDAILLVDNRELNICDYYDYQYSIKINQQEDIEQKQGFIGQLTATVMLNDEVIDMPLKWSTSDLESVIIDEQGNYQVIGEIGSITSITCCIDKNEQICDSINIKVVNDYLLEKILIVEPNDIIELRQGFSVDFKCGVYINGEKQTDIVNCIPNWNNSNYTLQETIDGYKLTNNKMSQEKLELTFSSGDLEPIIMKIELRGLF